MPVVIGGSGPVTGVTSINTTVSDTELGYLDGVTSALQTQIDGKVTGSNAAWTSYAPTVTSGTGTITTATATGKYVQFGKTVIARGTVTITTAGTGAGGLFVTAPVTALAAGTAGTAAETNATAWALACWMNSTTQLHIYKYDGTTVIANSRTVQFSVVYEAA